VVNRGEKIGLVSPADKYFRKKSAALRFGKTKVTSANVGFRVIADSATSCKNAFAIL
jgi:hypothetical protein